MDNEKRFTSNDLFNFAEFCMTELVRIPPRNPNEYSTITGESLGKIQRILLERKVAHAQAIKQRDELQEKEAKLTEEFEELQAKENILKNAISELDLLKERKIEIVRQIKIHRANAIRNLF